MELGVVSCETVKFTVRKMCMSVSPRGLSQRCTVSCKYRISVSDDVWNSTNLSQQLSYLEVSFAPYSQTS